MVVQAPLISREEAASAYADLQREFAPLIDSRWIEFFPPWLCRHLTRGDLLARNLSLCEAFVGEPGHQFVSIGDHIRFACSFPQALLNQLDLAGHTAHHHALLPAELSEALTLLHSRHPERLSSVLAWTSLVVPLGRGDMSSNDTLVTSVAIPHFPHCSFISRKATQHIPPSIIFCPPTAYALAENLYHESLHQQLNTTILFGDVFSDYTKLSQLTLSVSWRKAEWPIDRILHAAWVYVHLYGMRRKELESTPASAYRKLLTRATEAAHHNASELLNESLLCRNAFTARGFAIVEHMQRQLHYTQCN